MNEVAKMNTCSLARWTVGFATAAAIAVTAMATPAIAQNAPDYEYTSDQIKVGNAGSECEQLGTMLGVEFTYAYKWNEDGTEGATNETEIANFLVDDVLDHSNTITILNSNEYVFDWTTDGYNSIGAVMVKAGTGYNVYSYSPQMYSDAGLNAYQGKAVSHVTFCWNKDESEVGQWCSPGYWRQPQHLDSWAATGFSTDDFFEATLGYFPMLSKKGAREGATPNPTLLQVLQYPQYYGGDAFNAVGDLLSGAHPDVAFSVSGGRVEDSCPLN